MTLEFFLFTLSFYLGPPLAVAYCTDTEDKTKSLTQRNALLYPILTQWELFVHKMLETDYS